MKSLAPRSFSTTLLAIKSSDVTFLCPASRFKTTFWRQAYQGVILIQEIASAS